jgi:hypothetical protein
MTALLIGYAVAITIFWIDQVNAAAKQVCHCLVGSFVRYSRIIRDKALNIVPCSRAAI